MFFHDTDLVTTNQARLSSFEYRDPFEINWDEKQYEEFTDAELVAAAGSVLVFDCESYYNYFIVAFKCIFTKRVVYFEAWEDVTINTQKLMWLASNFILVGFNSNNYDLLMLALAIQGRSTEEMKRATVDIIENNLRRQQVEQAYGIQVPRLRHIDLIEVAPLKASLKLYGGRLHSPRLQELPIAHNARLTDRERKAVKLYCINDLDLTGDLFKDLTPALELRDKLGQEYQTDLLSKSDAQIAEAVISAELQKINGYWPKRPKIDPGTSYKYEVPKYIQYQTASLQRMLETVRNANFIVGDDGSIEMPREIANLKLTIGQQTYKMGIGGLHSTEETVAHKATDEIMLIDKDVASYYPSIILNLELFPKHLGRNFLKVYRSIVARRMEAKRTAPKGVIEQSLKITINGSFGKLGSKYSVLYAPDLMIKVTVTGQLALLLLIEMIELQGIRVVSANTDGILIKCNKDQYQAVEMQVIHWQRITGFETEETRYKAIYNRDVNNYIAIQEDGKVKMKGTYSERGSSGNSVLSKNPECLICNDALVNFLGKNIPIDKTIRECKDMRRFVVLRNVKGGAEKSGSYLGRVVRWYYSNKIQGTINYVSNGNKVPNSDNAMPLQDLPLELPSDLDYDHYIARTKKMLEDIGYYGKRNKTAMLF
jgi:hypothetical protein